METPDNQNGLRTELIMSKLKEDVYNNEIPVSKYNQMYSIVYETLEKVSTKNLITALREGVLNMGSRELMKEDTE